MQKNTIFTLLAVVGFIFLWDTFVMSRYAAKPATAPVAATAPDAAAAAADAVVVDAVIRASAA